MKKGDVKETSTTAAIVTKIVKIMQDRQLTGKSISDLCGMDPTTFSKIVNGRQNLSVENIAQIASGMKMSICDLIEYPHHMVPADEQDEPMVSVVFEVPASKRGELLAMVERPIRV